MTAKKSARNVFILLIISGVLLLLSFVDVLPSPVCGAKRFQIDSTLPDGVKRPDEQPDESKPDDVQISQSTPSDEPSDTTVIGKIELPVVDNDPDQLPPGVEALRTWPATLSVPKLHEANLDEYKTRAASARGRA